MGNPTAQSRTNASKPNMKPKHRLSGSVSNISFTSEDLKPKHRHSGSASNISLTPEDLKPKHRHSGSASNISPTPEDLKPKHRHSGSVSNISNAPENLLPKHRHSGSFSNISIISKDFSSPSRGDVGSPSSCSSVSAASASLKEKRLKRRARSSLGGTEDFIKELDFFTPLSNGRTPESNTRKDLLKLSPSATVSEPANLQDVSKPLPAAPESFVPVPAEVVVGNVLVEDANHSILAKANVSENGGSLHYETLIRSANESAQQSHAVQLAEPKCNGLDGGSTGFVETSNDEQVLVENVGEHGNQLGTSSAVSNGHLPVVVPGLPMTLATAEESDCTAVSGDLKEAEEVPQAVVALSPPANSLASDQAGPSLSQHASETQEFVNSLGYETAVRGGIVSSSETGDSQTDPSAEVSSQSIHDANDPQEEKVSVQQRVEELEKIVRGRPVHFRSQSLSLPRPFDISRAKHHEAEGSKGFKMPAYRAPLDGISISEVSSLEQVGMSPDGELRQESLHCEGMSLTDEIASTAYKVRPAEAEPLNVSRNQDGQSEPQTGKSPLVKILGKPKLQPHVVPVLSEGLKAVECSTDSVANGIHVENGTTAGSFQCVPVRKIEYAVQAGTSDDLKTQPTVEKERVVKIRNADGVDPGLGKPFVIMDTVPQELPVTPAVIHTEAPPYHREGSGGPVETAEAGLLGEPLAGRLKTEKPGLISAAAAETGVPLATHHRSSFPGAPYVPASKVEQASQDYEASMLLTKQPAVDPLFIDSQLDRLWEMHSQELAIGESSGNEVRESSAQDDDPRQLDNGIHSHAEVTPATSNGANGNAQSDKSGKHDRPRTPLRSLLAEEDAEKSSDSGPLGTPPQNQSASPRGSLFKRIVSGGKNSPTKQTTPTKLSPKNPIAAKPFLSSCICCSVK